MRPDQPAERLEQGCPTGAGVSQTASLTEEAALACRDIIRAEFEASGTPVSRAGAVLPFCMAGPQSGNIPRHLGRIVAPRREIPNAPGGALINAGASAKADFHRQSFELTRLGDHAKRSLQLHRRAPRPTLPFFQETN
ncbi:hypothetical protein [Mesorhizobium sp. M0522]|uniref:hypothetical protein n=1 Tax=Mesorhizobium sp. M0522 TaxID=2956958 RepID=UPI00333C207F